MALAVSPVFGFADGNIKIVVKPTLMLVVGVIFILFDQSTGKGIRYHLVEGWQSFFLFYFQQDGLISMLLARENNGTAVLNSIGYDPVNSTFAFKKFTADTCVAILVMCPQMAKIAPTLTTLVVLSLSSQFLSGTLDKSLLPLGSVKGGP